MKIFTYEKKTYLLNNNLVSSKVHEKCFLTEASEKQKQENINILDKSCKQSKFKFRFLATE